MSKTHELFTEINQNYNDLGEDLVMLEAILLLSEGVTEFPAEYIISSKKRLQDYICQHMGEIEQLTGYLTKPPHQRAPRPSRFEAPQ